ncbi:11903_t:CDS:2, partial [Ambispora gerdemannii]
MELPCAHYIQHLEENQSLTLDDIHMYWWIQGHLSDLQERYQEWPEFQQSAIRTTLNSMINTPAMVLQNPKVVSTKGRPSGTTNHQGTNSTRRDPSGF